MASYVVLMPSEPADAVHNTIVLRDGFAWLAFLFAPLWCLAHRLWLTAAACLLVGLGLLVFAHATGEALLAVALCALFVLWLGLEGNGLRLAGWLRQGWQIQAIIEAPDHYTAEAIFFAGRGTIGSDPTGRQPPEAVRTAPAEARNLVAHGSRGSARPALGFIDYEEGR